MINQKEVITKVLEQFNRKALAYIWIMNWLEDINWHREHNILFGILPDTTQKEIATVNYKLLEGTATYEANWTKEYGTIVRLFGYGLNTKDWNYTSGSNFVEELIDIVEKTAGINEVKQAEQDYAYSKAYID